MNKEQLIEAVKNIPIVAERDAWSLTLDKEEGSLFYAPKVIPTGSQLHQITDEYALYFDADRNPQGVVVDYYRANFLKHHKSFKQVSFDVFGKTETEKGEVVAFDSEELKENGSADMFRALLESTLIKEAGMNPVPA